MADADQHLPAFLVREEDARSPLRIKLALDEAQCQLLAARFDIEGVKSFALRSTITRMKGRKLRAEGELTAEVSYMCGTSLQPFDAQIDEAFTQLFIDDGGKRVRDGQSGGQGGAKGAEIVFDALAEFDAEPMEDGAADIAELAYQTFAMALEPFPRHPNARHSDVARIDADHQDHGHGETKPAPAQLTKVMSEDEFEVEEQELAKKQSPFAVLKDLKH